MLGSADYSSSIAAKTTQVMIVAVASLVRP